MTTTTNPFEAMFAETPDRRAWTVEILRTFAGDDRSPFAVYLSRLGRSELYVALVRMVDYWIDVEFLPRSSTEKIEWAARAVGVSVDEITAEVRAAREAVAS